MQLEQTTYAIERSNTAVSRPLKTHAKKVNIGQRTFTL